MPSGRGTKKPGSSRKRASKPRTKAEEQAQEPINGVLVHLTPGENPGDRALSVQALGDVKLTEAPTILRLAAKNAESQLGVD